MTHEEVQVELDDPVQATLPAIPEWQICRHCGREFDTKTWRELHLFEQHFLACDHGSRERYAAMTAEEKTAYRALMTERVRRQAAGKAAGS